MEAVSILVPPGTSHCRIRMRSLMRSRHTLRVRRDAHVLPLRRPHRVRVDVHRLERRDAEDHLPHLLRTHVGVTIAVGAAASGRSLRRGCILRVTMASVVIGGGGRQLLVREAPRRTDDGSTTSPSSIRSAASPLPPPAPPGSTHRHHRQGAHAGCSARR
jgi:hypothetical protein